MDVTPKPPEFLALHEVTEELFDMLQRWFDVPATVALDLSSVDPPAVVREMTNPVMVAALAMRKLQALHLLATPGVRTSTDVVVTIVQDLARALVQAPNMRLKLAAEKTDWDAAFAALDDDGLTDDLAPIESDASDPETDRFNELHAMLHVAVEAVLEATDGEIHYLE
ncbi:MAG: hypothetical protein ACOYNI_01850 [Acidimicrobiia bacterium]